LNKKLRYSIIIPTFNYGSLLPRALDSALNQPGDDYEVIVIDDGSTDNTEAVIKPYLKQFKCKLSYIKQSNQGAAAARNNAIDASNGLFLLFLDADDALMPSILTKLTQFITGQPTAKIIIGDYIVVHNQKQKKRHNDFLSTDDIGRFAQFINKKLAIAHGAILMHRDVFEKIRYSQDLPQGEDIPVFAQALALYPCALLNEPMATIYKHADSLRHQVKFTDTFAYQLTLSVFDEDILPQKFFKFRQTFLTRRLLSMFRDFYLNGQYNKADLFFRKALKIQPFTVIRPTYMSKWLKCLFKKSVCKAS